MKKYLFLIVMMSLNQHFYAQNKTIDSLKSALKHTKHDTARCNILAILSETANDEEWPKFNEQLITLCETNLNKNSFTPLERLLFQKHYATALNNSGLLLQMHGEIAKGLDQYLKSLKIKQEVKDKKGEAACLINIGQIYKNQGDNSSALDFFSKSLIVNQEIQDKYGLGYSLGYIALVYHNQGDINKALEYYYKSLKMRQEIKDKSGTANSLANIGLIYQQQGDLTAALNNYDLSLKIRLEIKDKKGIAESLSIIGKLNENLGNETKSFDIYTKCLKIQEEIKDKKGMANTLNNIGVIFDNHGDLFHAQEYYSRSLKMYEELQFKKGISYSLNNLGFMYTNLGMMLQDKETLTKALDHLNRSLEIRREIKDKSAIANSLNNIAFIYQNYGDPLCQLSKIKCVDEGAKKAIDYYFESLKLREETQDKESISNSLNTLGVVYFKLKNFQKAQVYFNKSMYLAKELSYPKIIRAAAFNLYFLYLKKSLPDTAQIYLSEIYHINNNKLNLNYNSLSEKEKELYFATLEKDYMLYYDFSNFYNNKLPQLTDTAFNISLTNKGLTLKSSTALRNTILSSADTTLIKEYEEWRSLKKKIAKLYESGKDTKEAENKANEIEKELVKKSNAFDDFNKVKNLDWKQVQKGLKKGDAAIEFVHFRSEIDTMNPIIYAALIVKPESIHPEMIRLCTEADLEKILGTFQGNNFVFVNKVYGTKKEAQTALYEKIWKPLEQSLKDIKNVYYSPTGLLHKISFAAISKSNNTYLCDNYKLHQQSSTGKVALPDNINYSSEDEFMLAGGVKYNSTKTTNEIWKYLPGTLSETQNIEKILSTNKHKTNYLVSEEANEESFKKNISSANVLHIATHGFFFPDPEVEREKLKKANEKLNTLVTSGAVEKRDTTAVVSTSSTTNDIAFRGTTNYANWSFVNNKNPLMRSGLVLANANDVWERDPLAEGEDGILTAQEVSNLNLRKTKLVVLSACETGLGDIKGSEGVYGLQRAFKMAGVKYIIMSLWQVPDKETSEFMTTFYDKLIKIKDIKKAFNDTQKEMRKKYDPYFWAAFVLVE